MSEPGFLKRIFKRLGVVSVWTVGLAVVVIAAASVALIWFSRQPTGSRYAVELVNRALSKTSNVELRAERLVLLDHGARIWGPSLVVTDSTGSRHALLRARRVELVTSWYGLVLGRPDAVHIELDHPIVLLKRDPSGRFILPRFRGTSKKEPRPESKLLLDLALRHGTVVVWPYDGDPDTTLRELSVEARAQERGGLWELTLDRLAARLPSARLAIEKADAHGWVSADTLGLDRLRVRTDAGWIEARGGGRITPRLQLEGTVSAGEWNWSDIARIARRPALDLPGGAAGTLAISIRDTVVTWRDGRFDVLWRNEPVTARFDGGYSGGRLHLDDAALRWRDTALDGDFELATGTGRWEIMGKLAHLDLSELVRLWPMPVLEKTDLGGDVRFAGDRNGLGGSVSRGSGVYRGMPFDSLSGAWTLARGTQTYEGKVRAAGGRVHSGGTIGEAGLALTVDAWDLEAGRIPLSLWQEAGLDSAPNARLSSLTARLDGPASRPRARGQAALDHVAYGALDLEDVLMSFDGPIGRSPDLALTARSGLARTGPLVADSASARMHLGDGRIAVESFRAAREESVLVLEGSAQRRGRDWEVIVDLLSWETGEALALDNDGPIQFTLRGDGGVDFESARVVSNAGVLSAQGLWGGDRVPSDLTLELETLDVKALLGPLIKNEGLRGTFTGQARIEGLGERQTWTVNLTGRDIHYDRLDAQELVARGRFAYEAWTVERLEIDTGRGKLSFEGVLEWEDPPPFGGSTEKWNAALRRAPRWRGRLEAEGLAIDELTEWYPRAGGWRGQLDAGIDLNGRPAAPVVRAIGTVREPAWGQAVFDNLRFDLAYDDELLTIRQFTMSAADTVGTVTGTVPIRLGWGVAPEERLPDKPMSVFAHMPRLDLKLLPLFLPQVAASGGRGEVRMSLTGTPKKPVLAGSAFIRDAIVRPAGREEVFTNVNGRIELEGDRLVIKELTARQGKKGRIDVTPGGYAKLAELRIESYEVDVRAQEVTAFASGEYIVSLDGVFRVVSGTLRNGPFPLPHITGRANVREGVFLTNFADPARQAASQGPAALPPWTYAIDVTAENNVWYRPSEANIEGKLDNFSIIQEPDRFLLLGTVEAIRGRYYFLANQFDMESGRLFFDAAHPNDPTMDATLTCEKALPLSEGGARETITLTVSDRVSKPTVTLSSSPTQLSQGEIVSLLTYGQLSGGAGNIGALGASYLARQITRQIPELSEYVGDIEIGQTVAEGVTGGGQSSQTYTTVGVSRYFTRDLLVRYSQVVGDVSQAASVDYQDVIAEYRLNQLFYLSGQVTRRRGILVTSEDETRYNIDIRARHEY
ncbi:MAG: translocation/assembly module TamB domain-containing protein [Candidatus Eiseniibacteriota bacterium]